ncbi:MAG: membrane-bound lytic murein transglycosylase MltF [Pseudomonadota bacterium]|jgi:membrane-bound lytic murein transglycosylase F
MRFLLCALVALAGCDKPAPSPLAESEELVVVVREGPLTFQRDDQGSGFGFEHDLLQLLAKDLGKELRLVVAADHREALQWLGAGKARLAAAGLVAEALESVKFSDGLRETDVVLVRHEESAPVRDVRELEGRPIEVLAGSGIAPALRRALPRASIVDSPASSQMALLERVAARTAELAVVDAAHVDIAANFFPVLESSLKLMPKIALAWAVRADDPSGLLEEINAFIARMRANGTLARITDRYFGHVRRLNQEDVVQFLARTETVLPRHRRLFQQAEEQTGLDWRLLAALAYQESHWDPLSTSPTGVRGIMMLTEETADRLGVSDRLDPLQSIGAGARYLADLRDALPPETEEPDRTWLALAAYNLGLGHLNGARAIARSLKKDPDSWYEMKQVLPLLARPEYYARLKSGRARGGEAVIMVENIRTYLDILQRYEAPHRPAFSPRRSGVKLSLRAR